MAVGILFMYADRVLPTVAEKRAELEAVIKPRLRQAMEADPFTDEQITRYEAAHREKGRYLFAKSVLGSPERRARFAAHQVNAMQSFVTSLEADPQRMRALERLERLGPRIYQFRKLRAYMEQGVGGMDDARLGQFLAMKQAQAFRRHDPVEAYHEERVEATCSNQRQYIVLFDGLDLATANGYCIPEDGYPKAGRVRRHRLRFDLLPQTARAAIEADLVPTVAWDPAYFEVKGG